MTIWNPIPTTLRTTSKYHEGPGEHGVIGIYLNQFPDTPYSRVYGNYRDQKFREAAYQVAPENAGFTGRVTSLCRRSSSMRLVATIPRTVSTVGKT